MPNPKPKKVVPLDLRSLARAHTEMAVRQLAGIAQHGESEPARVAACSLLLDRGWGKAEQPHTGNVDHDIKITIRQIIADNPKLITVNPNERKDD